jgi:hypothetical protein
MIKQTELEVRWFSCDATTWLILKRLHELVNLGVSIAAWGMSHKVIFSYSEFSINAPSINAHPL